VAQFLSFAYLTTWQIDLLRGLGVRMDDAPSDARVEVTWLNLPESWGALVLIGMVVAVLYAIVWLYRREMKSCPLWVKGGLAALRCSAVLVIVGILLGPAMVYVQRRTLEATISVGRDASRSMGTADRYEEREAAEVVAEAMGKSVEQIAEQRPKRGEVVNRVLAGGTAEVLKALAQKGRLEVFDFSDQVVEVDASRSLPPLVPTQGATNLASAIERGLAANRPGAMVLFSDGQHTAKEDVQEAARKAAARGVPLFLVGVGDPSLPRVEHVTSVAARPQAWQGEPFEVDAVVQFQNTPGGPRRVQLFESRLDEDGQPVNETRLVATETIEVPEAGTGQTTVHFSRTVSAAGRYVYRAQLADEAILNAQREGEASSDVVQVLSRQTLRVLLVSGNASWDYRLLTQLLARDKTIELSCWLQAVDEGRGQEGTRPIAKLPQTRGELFEYDVILLLDPNPEELDPNWGALVREFVGERAGGLLYMAGPNHSSRFVASSNTGELAKLLPVRFGDLAAMEIAAIGASQQRAWPLHLAVANMDHPVLRFYPDANDTLRRWHSLPGVLWSFPASEAAPAATMLAEHSDLALRGERGQPRPLLVAGRYGSGNTIYLGFNGTWRWRSVGREAEFFDKFWIQAVRFLAEGRGLENRRRGYVQTDRQRYEVGERVVVAARLTDANFEPLKLDEVEAVIATGDSAGERLVLSAVADQPGRYEGAFTVREAGRLTVRVMVPAVNEQDAEHITTNIVVELPRLETSQVWLNRPLLMELAKLSGGKYFEVNELAKLAAAVPNRTEILEERSRPRPLWDGPATLIVLVGLLSLEWLLRRRFDLL
jgi:hypothetical protein